MLERLDGFRPVFLRVFTTIKFRHRKRVQAKESAKIDKNFNSSKSNISQLDWLILQGKFETLGSNFSHETRPRGCWRPCYYENSCL